MDQQDHPGREAAVERAKASLNQYLAEQRDLRQAQTAALAAIEEKQLKLLLGHVSPDELKALALATLGAWKKDRTSRGRVFNLANCASILSRRRSPLRSGVLAAPVRFTWLHTSSSGFRSGAYPGRM